MPKKTERKVIKKYDDTVKVVSFSISFYMFYNKMKAASYYMYGYANGPTFQWLDLARTFLKMVELNRDYLVKKNHVDFLKDLGSKIIEQTSPDSETHIAAINLINNINHLEKKNFTLSAIDITPIINFPKKIANLAHTLCNESITASQIASAVIPAVVMANDVITIIQSIYEGYGVFSPHGMIEPKDSNQTKIFLAALSFLSTLSFMYISAGNYTDDERYQKDLLQILGFKKTTPLSEVHEVALLLTDRAKFST